MEQDNFKPTTILIIVSMGFFMVCLDATVVNVALNDLKMSFDANLSDLQWIVASYTIAFATLLLSAGSLGDLVGPKKIFCIGLVIFTVASLMCGIAQTLSFLVFSRVIQGIGAALLVANSLSLLQQVFKQPADRAKAFGVWGGLGGVATAIGPVAGGLLIARLGWPSAFLLNLPFGGFAIFMAQKHIPEIKTAPREIKPMAQIFIAASLGALAYTFIAAGVQGWYSTKVFVSSCMFVITGLGFVLIENNSNQSIFPKGIFRSRKFTAATIVGLIINLGFYGQLFIISLYFQQIKSYSTMVSGFALLPQAVIMAMTAYYCGKATAKLGAGIPMVIGLLSTLIGLAGLISTDAASSYVGILIPMLLTGFGMSSIAPATVAACMSSAPAGQGGITSGIINAARQSGSVMGVAILGSVLGNQNLTLHTMHLALLITVPLYLFALGLTVVWILPRNALITQPAPKG